MRIDFRHYVDKRTSGYTPRPWLTGEIAGWLRDPGPARYFFLTGEPGSGKTAVSGYIWLLSRGALPPDEANVPPGSIAAHHFCFARSRQSLTPGVFAASVAEQLAMSIPEFDKVRLEPFKKDLARIESHINVTGTNNGPINGVAVGHDGDAESAFSDLVHTPLQQLYAQGFDRDVFILVDALDEARQFTGKISIADLVTLAEGMPARVRFLLTSRPDQELLDRIPVEELRPLYLSDPAVRDRARDDVRRHLALSIAGDNAIRGRLAGDVPETLFVSTLAEKADGNFLWTRIALDTIRKHEGPVTAAVLDALPFGLHATYLDFLRRIAPDAERWQEGDAALVFGTLAVAQGELTEAQLAAYTGAAPARVSLMLGQARQLLDVVASGAGATYAIYHRSLVDFLLNPATPHAYAVDAMDPHRRIAEAWIHKVGGPQPDWDQSDDYTLRHISAHLFALRHEERYATWLQRLVCREWRELKEKALHSDASFANDVMQAIEAASEVWPRRLEEQLFAISVLANVRSRGESLPNDALRLLVRLGRRAEAMAYAELRPEAAEAWIAIAQELLGDDPAAAESLARRVIGVGTDDSSAWRTLVRAVARLKRFDEVRQMLASPALAKNDSASWTRQEVAGDAVAAGELDFAEEIALTLEEGHLRSAMTSIFLAAVARRDWTRAKRLFASFPTKPYGLVAMLMERAAGSEAEVVAFLRENGTAYDLYEARRAAERFAEEGHDERALAVAASLDEQAKRAVREAQIRRTALSGTAEQMAAIRAGASGDELAGLDALWAMTLLSGRASDAAAVLRQTPDRAAVFNKLVAMLRHRVGGYARLTALLDAMDEAMEQPADEWLVHEAERASWDRDFAGGKQLAARISDPRERTRAASALVNAALEQHDAAMAEELWRELAPQGQAPSRLVISVASAGRLDDALALLTEPTWQWPDAAMDVAERLVAAGRIDDAVLLGRTADSAARYVRDVGIRVITAVAREAPEQLASVVARLSPEQWNLCEAVRITARYDVEAAMRLAPFVEEWYRAGALCDAALDRLDEGDADGAKALTSALVETPRSSDTGPMLEVVEAFAAAGHSDRAREVADELGLPDAESQLVIAEATADADDPARGDPEAAKAMLLEIDGSIRPNRRAIRNLTRLAVALLPPKEAAEVFLRAHIADGRLLASLAASGAIEHATATLAAVAAQTQDDWFREALPRLAARGDWRAAAMLAVASQGLTSLLVQAASVDAIAPALAEARPLAGARDLEFALFQAAKSVEGAAAAALLAEMPAEEQPPAQERIERLISSGDYVAAINVAMEIEDEYLRTDAMAEVVVASAERNGYVEAFGFAAYDEPVRLIAIERAALKLAHKGKSTAADLMLALPADEAARHNEWVAEELATNGNVDAALRIVDRLRGRVRTRALGKVAAATAVNAPDRALELAAQVGDPQFSLAALAAIAEAYVKRGEGDRAFELATSPRLAEAATNHLTSIAVALYNAGRRDLGERLLDRAIFAGNSVSDRWERNVVFVLLCEHALDRGDVAEAERFAACILPFSVSGGDALLRIARAHAEGGRREEARSTLRRALASLSGSRSYRRLNSELDVVAALVALDGPAGIAAAKAWCETQHGARRVQVLVQLTERQLAGRIRHLSRFPSSVPRKTALGDRIRRPFVRLVERYRVSALAKAAEAELRSIDSEPERIVARGWLVFLRSGRGGARRTVAAAREVRDFALTQRPTDTRSIALSQAAIALRRAGKEEWQAITEELLRMMRDLNDWEELRVAGDWIAFIAGHFGDEKLAEALIRTVWQKNGYGAGDALEALTNRLRKPEQRVRAGRVLAGLATAAGSARRGDILAILKSAGTDETLIDAAEQLAHRAGGEDALAAFTEGVPILARSGSSRTARWIELARQYAEATANEPVVGAYIAAKIAAAQSQLGLRDEALVSLGVTFRDGRIYDRDIFFEMLDAVLPALHRIDGGETLSRVARRIAESESWWKHWLVEE